jgi:hypothetical protein
MTVMCAVVRLRALITQQAARLITNPPIDSVFCINLEKRGSPISECLLFLGQRVGGVPFLDSKKDKLKDNSIKRYILTTFGATKAQKLLKRG